MADPVAIHKTLKMYDDGTITAEQALAVIKIDCGYAERSPESVQLGRVIEQVANGDLPAAALPAVINEEPRWEPPTYPEADPVHRPKKR